MAYCRRIDNTTGKQHKGGGAYSPKGNTAPRGGKQIVPRGQIDNLDGNRQHLKRTDSAKGRGQIASRRMGPDNSKRRM